MTSPNAGANRPPRHAWKRNPVFQFLASLRLAVVLLGVLIVMSIAGTIAESKFDADTARLWIYEAPWFNLWMALLAANLTCSALMRWPWTRRHTGFLLTHLGIIVVMLGAVVGQTWGVEGTMTLFKNAAPDNTLVLQKRQLTIRDPGSRQAVMVRLGRRALQIREGKPADLWTTPGGWKIDAVESSSRLMGNFVPSPSPSGHPAVLVRLQTKAMNQSAERWLLAGDRENARLDLGLITVDLLLGNQPAPASGADRRAIVRVNRDAALTLEIATGEKSAAPVALPVAKPAATGWMDWTIEVVEAIPSAAPGFRFEPWPDDRPVPPGQRLLEGVKIRAIRGSDAVAQWVAEGWRVSLPTGVFPVEVAYGWEVHRLPFGLVLEDFVVERNEGTDEPASFRSDLAMVLPGGVTAATGSCSMNRPANFPDAWWRSLTGLTYKISQASWNPNDLSQSSVQILRDPGWFFKWTGSLILCAGLVIMFTMRRPAPSAKPPSADVP